MQSSPPNNDGKARAAHAIRQLSRSLSHSPRPIPSPSEAPSDSNPAQQFGESTSQFFSHGDFLASTNHNIQVEEETHTLPHAHLRSTAKKYGTWQMPKSEAPVPDTSMVKKHFADFDDSVSDGDDDLSIEQARGGNRSNRSMPGKINNSSYDGFNSIYDISPPSARPRKSYPAETGSLRRDAQIRRASRNDMETASPRHVSARNSPAVASNQEKKRTSLAKLHAKVSEDESSFMEERPPTVTLQAKTTRFSGGRSRQASAYMDPVAGTPSRIEGTPRSRSMTAQNATAQSFMLPDLPNLTELVSGVFEDSTPVFSKAAPPRSRFATSNNPGRPGGRHPNHIPVDSVPIPEEEKAIFASLQLLKEKVSQLEHERAEADKKIEEQEIEIIELRASKNARDNLRRSNSGLGSTDGEASGKAGWKVEKTRLEASVETLRTRLDRSDRKLSVSEIANKRITAERDNLVSQLSIAFQNFEDIKREKEALHTENDHLRQEVDSLRAENESLRDRLEQEHELYQEETQNLRRQVDRTENVVHQENETLRVELARVRAHQDDNAQQLARKEAELRKARKEQAEHTKLKADNEALKAQVASFKAKREEESRRWKSREAELKDRISRRDDTIRHFEDMTQEHTNEAIRIDNENLRQELAQLAAQQEDQERRWTRREQEMTKKIRQRSEAYKNLEDRTQELLNIRQTNTQPAPSTGGASADKENTSTQQKLRLRREDTRTRIANRVQEASRNSRAVSTSYTTGHPEKGQQKSSTRFSATTHRSSLPADGSRSVSAPIAHGKQAEVDSDVDSTTDLSFAPRGTPYVMRGGASGKPTTAPSTTQVPAPLDETELSFIDGEVIAALRRSVEEEYIRSRSASVPVERQTREDTTRSRQVRDDTVRSATSAKSARQPSLPRKSSMKDVTDRTNATVFEDLTGKLSNLDGASAEPTQTNQSGAAADISMLSNTSRRRCSAPAEMTSAFIVPDITIHTRKQSYTRIDVSQKLDLTAHDNENCMVCRRNAEAPPSEPLRVPKLVPVSSRMPDDVDATLRPSRSPKEALALVVKEMQDELAHLHLELRTTQAVLQAHDPSLGMKNRRSIEAAISDLLDRISAKSNQIYHLYDVLEGQSADHEITEQELEELTREIRVEEEQAPVTAGQKGKEKKVTIQSYIESDNESEHSHVLSSGEEELPWEGFEETASHSFNLGKLGVGASRSY
ncbi:hypothetical protein BCR34DRAFT_491813 [Clohesyomyces aquaticus]|uniref:Cep57 centrosome microtubule-binding domain-containing protein n=1 Tax=Clohesyomyces aquaticus TaxID=1231657 RepID=A0A1Y1Z1G4_9PLEO|nr:hypothetical protein BCR34DRAFT_491813 [Clohesyomyces aquaticus]